MQVLGFHFVKNAKNVEILHVTGSNPVQYVWTATSMTLSPGLIVLGHIVSGHHVPPPILYIPIYLPTCLFTELCTSQLKLVLLLDFLVMWKTKSILVFLTWRILLITSSEEVELLQMSQFYVQRKIIFSLYEFCLKMQALKIKIIN